MKQIGIVGSGVMGTDICHIAAESGIEVILYDIDGMKMKESFNAINSRLIKYAEEGRIKRDRVGEIISRIRHLSG